MSYDPPRPYRPHLVSPTVSRHLFHQHSPRSSDHPNNYVGPAPAELRFAASSTVYHHLVRCFDQLARPEQGEVASSSSDDCRPAIRSSSGSSTATASRSRRTPVDVAETASCCECEGTSSASAAAVAPFGSGRPAAADDAAAAPTATATRRAGEAGYVLGQKWEGESPSWSHRCQQTLRDE